MVSVNEIIQNFSANFLGDLGWDILARHVIPLQTKVWDFSVMTERNGIFLLLLLFFISFIPKYNNYNNNYHIAYIHTRTTHLSTHAIIQSLYMISLFKALPTVSLQVLFKRKSQINCIQSPLA